MTKTIDESWLTTTKSEQLLGPVELEIYRDHRRELLTWMVNEGKVPDANIGYAEETVKNRAHRLDLFYRWVWEVEDGYTEEITTTHANAWTKYFHPQPHSTSYKAAVQKAIQTLFRWQQHEHGSNVDWDPIIRYNSNSLPTSREGLTREERTKLREAAVAHGTIPHYNSLSPEERDRYKKLLAMRLGKPKTEVSKQDFFNENSWKWPSLIWTSVDAGLRPKEVGRAKVSWVDTEKGVLRIPPEDAVKNDASWTVGLLDRTVRILKKWIKERECKGKYDETDRLWLTRYGNPYQSGSLNHWFRKFCDDAGIDRSNRNLSWYSIRHSVGTHMVREHGIGAASEQLRHKSMNSTLRYVRATVQERKEVLERMG